MRCFTVNVTKRIGSKEKTFWPGFACLGAVIKYARRILPSCGRGSNNVTTSFSVPWGFYGCCFGFGFLFVCLFVLWWNQLYCQLQASGQLYPMPSTFGSFYICFPCNYSVFPVKVYLKPGVMFNSREKCDFWYLYFKSKVCLGLK